MFWAGFPSTDSVKANICHEDLSLDILMELTQVLDLGPEVIPPWFQFPYLWNVIIIPLCVIENLNKIYKMPIIYWEVSIWWLLL